MNDKEKKWDYDAIMSDRKLFNETVYTPLSEAIRLLDERQKDPELMKKVEELLGGDIPEVLKNRKCGVQFRQIATPNNDTKHFISINESFELSPIFFEYFDDKFTSNNDYKHSLGKLNIQNFVDKNDYFQVEKFTIIDFNKYNGKKIKEVLTLWNEPLIDFHKSLFSEEGYQLSNMKFYDASKWFKNHGPEAIKYYSDFFLLFVAHGILFENFLFNKEDSEFTQKVALPALYDVIKKTKNKPLIVPIGPIDIENDHHWISYSKKIKKLIDKNNI